MKKSLLALSFLLVISNPSAHACDGFIETRMKLKKAEMDNKIFMEHITCFADADSAHHEAVIDMLETLNNRVPKNWIKDVAGLVTKMMTAKAKCTGEAILAREMARKLIEDNAAQGKQL